MPDRQKFPIPDVIDPPRVCLQIHIPGTPQHKQVIAGLFWELTKRYNWKYAGGTSGKEVAEVYADVYAGIDWSNMSCCEETTVIETRLNDDGTTQISVDGGETWIDNPSDPRIDGVQYPPLPGADGEDKKCKGANSVTDYVKDCVEQFGNTVTTVSGIFAVAAAFVFVILAVFSVAGGFLPLVPVFLTLAAAVIGVGKDAYIADFTDDVYDDFTCIIFCHIEEDASFTPQDVLDILTDIDSQFTGNVALTFTSQIKALQASGLTNAARTGLSAVIDCSGCGCGDGCNLDNWHVYGSEAGEGATEYGTEVSRDEVSITVDSANVAGGNYVILWTADPSKCCVISAIEVMSGTADGAGCWVECGADFPVVCGAIGDRCVYLVQANSSVSYQIKYTFSVCP